MTGQPVTLVPPPAAPAPEATEAIIPDKSASPESMVDRINGLYRLVNHHVRTSVETGLELGQVLCECRQSIGHGDWQTWIATNLTFSYRTARRYEQLWSRRDDVAKFIENGHVSLLESTSLTAVYRHLEMITSQEEKEVQKAQNGIEADGIIKPKKAKKLVAAPKHPEKSVVDIEARVIEATHRSKAADFVMEAVKGPESVRGGLAHQQIETNAHPERTNLLDMPAYVQPGVREAALVTLVAQEMQVSFKAFVEALKVLEGLTDWSHAFLIADEMTVSGRGWSWRRQPLRKYASFQDFYEQELAKTFGDWKELLAKYR
jgi:Protein of unknown function (DUF3102)